MSELLPFIAVMAGLKYLGTGTGGAEVSTGTLVAVIGGYIAAIVGGGTALFWWLERKR